MVGTGIFYGVILLLLLAWAFQFGWKFRTLLIHPEHLPIATAQPRKHAAR